MDILDTLSDTQGMHWSMTQYHNGRMVQLYCSFPAGNGRYSHTFHAYRVSELASIRGGRKALQTFVRETFGHLAAGADPIEIPGNVMAAFLTLALGEPPLELPNG